MKIFVSTIALALFCLTNAAAAYPISQSSASTICANHGGMKPLERPPGATGCLFCSASYKRCTSVWCTASGCGYVTNIAPIGSAGVAAPVKSTPEKIR